MLFYRDPVYRLSEGWHSKPWFRSLDLVEPTDAFKGATLRYRIGSIMRPVKWNRGLSIDQAGLR